MWYFSNPLPDEETETSAITNKFAGWKTYRNEEFGFEFKYPTDWDLESQKDKNGIYVGAPYFRKDVGEGGRIMEFYITPDTLEKFISDYNNNDWLKYTKTKIMCWIV